MLDIGAGQGRNSLFLAKQGFEVEALDKSKEAIEQLREAAQKKSLPIKAIVADIKDFDFGMDKYWLIITINSLHFMKLSETEAIIRKIKKALVLGGIFYMVVTSTKDPACKRCRENLKAIEKDTFFVPMLSSERHFYTKRELASFLKNFKEVEIFESKARDTHDRPHFHYSLKVIAKK